MSFENFDLAEPVLRSITAQGYTTPTPIQAEAIPHLVAGRDLLGCAQTGTGKTAAFAVPLLHRLTHEGNPPRGNGRRVRALILAPTRELAAQIFESCRTYGRFTGLRYAVIYGGVSQTPQVRALRNGADVVIATPGRLLDLMNQRHLDLQHVEFFVLDEADRMLDMGFMPDIKRIVSRLPAERQTIFFSATMPPEIERLANVILKDPVQVRIAPQQTTAEHIEESVCFVAQPNKMGLLIEMIQSQAVGRALVFTKTKHGADRVAKHLVKSGINAEAMHGDKSQSARQRILQSFKSKQPPVLVATDVASRGIDVTAVSHVFNFDLPIDPETYVHRIGRTGRAGAAGCAVSFCDPSERRTFKAIERLLRRAMKVDPASQLPATAPTLFRDKIERPQPGGGGRGARPTGGGGNKRRFRRPEGAGNRSSRKPAPVAKA
jgi:ATP-dependent RNA helicase RhlE